MGSQKFYLVGEGDASALEVDISGVNDIEALKSLLSGQFAVVEPSGK
jgi:hypothetical protein